MNEQRGASPLFVGLIVFAISWVVLTTIALFIRAIWRLLGAILEVVFLRRRWHYDPFAPSNANPSEGRLC